jgi:hypothetical protein
MSLVLNVEILGEYKNLAKATKGAENSFKDLGTKFAGIGKNIAKVTAGIGIGLGVAVASQIKPAIDAASDLSEATNAVNVSFGEAAVGVLKLGENAARGLGLSKSELYGIATQFSSFANTIAGEGGNVVQVVDDISNRGADFASVFNLDVSDALAKFQSGLAGSSEPLRAYGIDLSAASVEAHALEKGIYDGVDAMTESEKVQARYSLLMEQTDKVTGDFANTSGEVANQQRILKATIENTRAEIGEKFLPIVQKIQEFILEKVIPAFMSFWDGLVDKDGVAQGQIEAIKEAFVVFASTFGTVSNEITQDQMFKWMGDSIIRTLKLMTQLSVYSQEVFEGIDLLFGGPDSRYSNSFTQKFAGLAKLAGAAKKAQAAADEIKFAPDIAAGRSADVSKGGMSPTQRFDQFGQPISITVNVNRAKVDANDLIRDINATLKTQGSNVLLR